MTKTSKIFFNGNKKKIEFEVADFSLMDIPQTLKKFGVTFHEGSCYVSSLSDIDYQKFSALHEHYCPLNNQGIKIDGVETCSDLERLIILGVVPSKQRARFARQRLKMFRSLVKYNTSVGNMANIEVFIQTRDMLSELVKKL